MQEEVFETSDFQDWAANRVNLVEVDFPQETPQAGDKRVLNETLKRQFDDYIEGFPTVVFVSPDGQVLGTLGYEKGGPDGWIQRAEEVISASNL